MDKDKSTQKYLGAIIPWCNLDFRHCSWMMTTNAHVLDSN
jgi:hypothetical protein